MRTRFITSVAKPGGFPDLGAPEIAFLGRSNVGKSSLLNVLAGAKIARISRTPGRTQLINFFEVQSRVATWGLVDLPGYGFARAPKEVQDQWEPLVESYLASRPQLRAALLLMDVRREVAEDDRQVFDFVREVTRDRAVEVLVVGTKLDKLAKAHHKPALAKIAAGLEVPREAVLGTSASARIGLDTLQERLEALLRPPR